MRNNLWTSKGTWIQPWLAGCVFTRPIYQLNILFRCLFTDLHLLVKRDICFHCEFLSRYKLRRFKLPKRATFKNGRKRRAFNDFSCIDSRYIPIEMMSPHLTSWGNGFCSQVLAANFLLLGFFRCCKSRCLCVLHTSAAKYIGSWLRPLVRWPTTVTAKINTSRQKKITHGKRKLPTAKRKDSRQKEKPLGKKKKNHGKKEKTHGKKKRLTEKRKTDSWQKKKGHGGWPSFSKYSMGKKSS